MLSLSQTSRLSLRSSLRSSRIVSRRTIFDYVRLANLFDEGKSLSQISEEDKATERRAAEQFSWSWIDWFKENDPQQVPQLESLRGTYRQYEDYAASRESQSQVRDIDFARFRDKIADPRFVDELEVSYYVQRNTLESIESMSTVQQWAPQALDEFEQDSKQRGEQFWKPISEVEKSAMAEKAKEAVATAEEEKLLVEELQKDFEQFDAERLMVGQVTSMMRMAEHPQFAEIQEDRAHAKQFNYDYILLEDNAEPYANDRATRIAGNEDEETLNQFNQSFAIGSMLMQGKLEWSSTRM